MSIFESKRVQTNGVARRLSKLVGPGQKKTIQEWVDTVGRNNAQMAIEYGILSEVISESDVISMDNVMKNGDYAVYHGDEGYVMYHMADDKIWRTVSDEIEGLEPDNSKEVPGVSIGDSQQRIVMSGHETPPAPPEVGTPKEIETQIDDEFDNLEIEMPEPEMEEPMAPEAEAPLPEPEMAPPPEELPL